MPTPGSPCESGTHSIPLPTTPPRRRCSDGPVGVKPFPCGVSPEASGRSLLAAIERATTRLRCSAPAQRGKRTPAVVENRPAIADQDGFDVRIRVENALDLLVSASRSRARMLIGIGSDAHFAKDIESFHGVLAASKSERSFSIYANDHSQSMLHRDKPCCDCE